MDRYNFTNEQRTLLEGLAQPLGIFQFLDKRVVTLVLSDGFCKVFGYKTREQAYEDMENNMYKYTHPDDVARIAEATYRFATEDGSYEVIYRTKAPLFDDYHIIHAMGEHVFTDDGMRLGHVWYVDEGVAVDDAVGQRTELNRAFNDALREESLARESNFDYLTGLPNMSYFFDLATAAKKMFVERGQEPTLLYMDLCGMKLFNTQNSYEEGDNLLREFARVLKDAFGDRHCCRVGADHFAAYTEGSAVEETLAGFFEACKSLNGGSSLPVRVGIYMNSMGDVTASGACDRAKFACDSLRDAYESCFCYYDSSLLDEAERRRHVLANLDRAIEEKWIQVHYQPIIRASNGKVCDEEALSRWFDPELGPLSPADFIPALEDAGKIYKLDLYVLEQALEKIQTQGESGLDTVPHSINLSRSDFTTCDIVEEIAKRVDAAGVDRSLITIEITESIFGSNPDYMKEQVGRFRSLGFPVWMDDFGSGYSSIDLLQSVEFDLVKFDMSFMRRFDEGEGTKIVLTELVNMATALGLGTLCEGVETEEQAQFLREIGCSKLQGFFFNKAMSFEEIVERFKNGARFGFENPDEVPYYDAIGRVSLYDLSAIANEDVGDELGGYFDTLPVAVIELSGDEVGYIRTNKSYRNFMKRLLGIDIEEKASGYTIMADGPGFSFIQTLRQCCDNGGRAFCDDMLPDRSTVHSFVRYVGSNPVSGRKAAVVAVLSISDESEQELIARVQRERDMLKSLAALSGSYLGVYSIDPETGRYTEFSATKEYDDFGFDKEGDDFFLRGAADGKRVVHSDDLPLYLERFTKENVMREIQENGAFSLRYRLMIGGKPQLVILRIAQVTDSSGKRLVAGVRPWHERRSHEETDA